MPSRLTKPCELKVAALRGRLLSSSRTVRRARTSWRAAARPAGPAPMMATSQRSVTRVGSRGRGRGLEVFAEAVDPGERRLLVEDLHRLEERRADAASA